MFLYALRLFSGARGSASTVLKPQSAHGQLLLGDEQQRAQEQTLCEAAQHVTGHSVKTAWAEQGYTGMAVRQAVQDSDIDLQIVKLPDAKKGFVLLPRRWGGGVQLWLRW